MSSREKILEAISKNKPAPEPLPEIVIDTEYNYSVLLQQFILSLQTIGATVIMAENIQTIKNAYIRGTLGVAENGAVWLQESKMINRLLPFICQHLVIVLDTNKIVANMHDAYRPVSYT